jgi:decaprenyl-phosphate phosphoribosyltransferase
VLRLLRPRQWIKNLLLFAALVFARQLFVPRSIALAALAFVAFCLASSSVYVVNDLVDVERDRQHPEKRLRPIASGAVPVRSAALVAAALTLLSLAISLAIGRSFVAAVIVYLGTSHFYSLAGKNVVVLDAMLVAAGFVIRAVAGALAIRVPYSDWFVLCTLFLALFIVFSKRRAELLALGGRAPHSRPALALYTEASLAAFTASSMAAAVISYSLYVQDMHERVGPALRLLPFTVPFVIFVIFRYHLLVERGTLGERPEEAIFRDRTLLGSLLGFAAVALAAFYGGG